MVKTMAYFFKHSKHSKFANRVYKEESIGKAKGATENMWFHVSNSMCFLWQVYGHLKIHVWNIRI